jgi:hypothetical protein
VIYPIIEHNQALGQLFDAKSLRREGIRGTPCAWAALRRIFIQQLTQTAREAQYEATLLSFAINLGTIRDLFL